MVCLSCTATGERVCLAAEGFGNRHCYLENIADKNIPPDLSQCVFVIEQALSVRALQELVTAAGTETVSCYALLESINISGTYFCPTIPYFEYTDGHLLLPFVTLCWVLFIFCTFPFCTPFIVVLCSYP